MRANVEKLCGRLAEAPPIFQSAVDPSESGSIHLAAVVADLFRDRASRPLTPKELARFGFVPQSRRHLELVLIASWLLHDDAFQGVATETLLAFVTQHLWKLSELVIPRAFVEDSERREELVRVCLKAVGATIDGEDTAISEDRLATLDSVRRDELLRDARTRDAEREARRRELARLRAQEEEDRRKAARTTFED